MENLNASNTLRKYTIYVMEFKNSAYEKNIYYFKFYQFIFLDYLYADLLSGRGKYFLF